MPMITLSNAVEDKGRRGGRRDRFTCWVTKKHPDKISYGKLNGCGHAQYLVEESVGRQLWGEYTMDPVSELQRPEPTMKALPSHEIAALAWEKDGYLVIRTYQKGCPDLIIIRPEDAPRVKLREVKGPEDKISREQLSVQRKQQEQGFDSDFQWIEDGDSTREENNQ